MSWFEYPLDSKVLLRKRRTIKSELLASKRDWVCKKIAVLGGSTTDEIVSQLELFLLNYGIRPEFYQSEYGQYWQDAMFGNDELDKFQPDIIFVHTTWRNITAFPTLNNTEEEVNNLLKIECKRFSAMWQSVRRKYHCPIIQNNFERPNYRLMGNRDIWDYRGRNNYIHRLNGFMYEYARKNKEFYINDIDYLAQDYGLTKWESAIYWYMYKYACDLEAIPYLAKSVADIIKAIFGKNRKALVLDLDNTLWGGIIGECGVEGIQIGSEFPQGQVYSEFQQYCKDLKQIGVILAVNSKNEKENAIAGLMHPDGILRPEDFVALKANWDSKDRNIRAIAEELSLGEDSFVFVDDNPAERELVANYNAAIAVPPIERAENYINVIDHSGYFEVAEISQEDLHKTEQYIAKAKIQKDAEIFEDYGDYLDSLEMKAIVSSFEPIYIQRIAQLTNKTNQFNLTSLRCSEGDIEKMEKDDHYICLCARLVDKFADNGIVSVIAGEIMGVVLHIRLWLMSCRVLKRGLEDTMMNELVSVARHQGIHQIIGYYYPTEKNQMVKGLYADMGGKRISGNEQESTIWEIELNKYQPRKTYMHVERHLDK